MIAPVQGQIPPPGTREHNEFLNYESGKADEEVRRKFGNGPGRWLSAVMAHEPHSLPALNYLLTDSPVAQFIQGRVLDCGAGSCWLSAKISQLERVRGVVAFDLSLKFLSSAGVELFRHLEGDPAKLQLAAGTFNRLPFEDNTFDCAFLFAVVHHSLSPISLISEALRTVKPGGAVIILESPVPAFRLEEVRRYALEISLNVSEIPLAFPDILYYCRMAGATDITTLPVDCVTRTRWRFFARKILRQTGLEPSLRPPTTLFIARKNP